MRMFNSNKMKNIDKSTEFVNSMITGHMKDGTFWLYLYPRHLNKNSLIEHFYLITSEKKLENDGCKIIQYFRHQ